MLLLVDALSFLGSVIFTIRIRHREAPPSRAARRPLHVEIGEGLSFVLRQPLLRRIVLTTSVSNLSGSVAMSLHVLFLVRDLGVDEAGLGLAFGVGALGGLAGAVLVEPVMRWVGEGRVIATVLLVCIPSSALVPLAAGRSPGVAITMFAVSSALFGFGVILFNVAQVSFRQRLCPAALLGRMNASVRFVVWGVMPIGALTGGIIGARHGIVTALWVSVLGQVIAILPVLLSPLLRMRDLPRELDVHAGA